MTDYARYQSDGPVHRLKRTCVGVPEKLRNRLWRLSRPFRGLQSTFFRKLFYDITRFAHLHSESLLRSQYANYYMNKEKSREPPDFLMNISISVSSNVYDEVAKILTNIRSPFIRAAIEVFVDQAEVLGEPYIEMVLDIDTHLEEYLPFLITPIEPRVLIEEDKNATY